MQVHERSFGSKLENLIVPQHFRPESDHARENLLHDELGFARLQVSNVDVGRQGQFRQLIGEQARAQMLGRNRKRSSKLSERLGVHKQIEANLATGAHRP